MVLGVDIGNTNIVVGGLGGGGIKFVSRIATEKSRTEFEYAIMIRGILNMYEINAEETEGAIISSVVPPLTRVMKNAVEMVCGREPLIVGPGIKTGLNIKTDNPAALGSDLVVDAVAALAEYKPPLIVIDMGTATTISVIDGDSGYMGGVIVPGMVISQNALSANTSQLPYIDISGPDRVIGRNTVECMKSGMIYGTASLIDGMTDRIRDELGADACAVATGGLSGMVVPHCRRNIIYDKDLLLKGLYVLFEKNSRERR
ncbi:MAG: type III pantothenate kinase [Oscillospiraceae bacterium]|nr:type III pantothenate kinase [Oscillospiraceae bacterium]